MSTSLIRKLLPIVFLRSSLKLSFIYLNSREVDREEAEDLAKRLNCEYLETSAKTGENVEAVFEYIARACLQNIKNY